MDLSYLLKILAKRRWLIIAVLLISTIAAYLLVSLQPDKYKSSAVLSTGIIEFKGVSFQKENPFVQEYQVKSSFNQLVEFMQSRKIVKLLSKRLVAHDVDELERYPFRYSKVNGKGLLGFKKDSLVRILLPRDSLAILEKNGGFNKLAASLGYDYESIRKNLKVARLGDTDYVTVEFESESPELSYFAVKTYIDEFMNYYLNDMKSSEKNSIQFYTQAVKSKKSALDDKLKEINDYKEKNQLVNVESQSKSLVSQIKDLEMRRESERQKIPALKKSIKSLNRYIEEYSGEEASDYANSRLLSDEIIQAKDRISELNDMLISGAKNKKKLERQLKEARKKLNRLVSRVAKARKKTGSSSDRKVDDLIKKKIDKEVELELATSSVASFDRELSKMRGRSVGLVENDAVLNKLEQEADILEKEYLSLAGKLSEARLYSEKTENPLTVVEAPYYPEKPEPSKKELISALAGFGGATLTAILLLLLALFDSRIRSAEQFTRLTKLPVLESVNHIDIKKIDLNKLFLSNGESQNLKFFKEAFRKIRYKMLISEDKSFLFVSPRENDGKSLIVFVLAHALTLNGKKVLVVDLNFKKNTLSYFANKSTGIDILDEQQSRLSVEVGNGAKSWLFDDPNISVIGNVGSSHSPLEVLTEKDLHKLISEQSLYYDYILIESAAMNNYADARELIPFVDKVVAVFSANKVLEEEDRNTVNFLRSLGDKFMGVVLNNVGREED